MKLIDTRQWWIFLIRGLISIAFGLLCVLSPISMGASLILVWGAFVLVDGAIALWFAIGGKAQRDPWLVGLQGVIGIIIGLIALFNPAVAGLGILIVVVAWSFVIGVLQIAVAISFRNEMTGELWLGLSGLISILFGAVLLMNPALGAVSLVWIIGFYSIAFGAALVGFAFRMKRHALRS